jgi:AcrR family transcriptional regulator
MVAMGTLAGTHKGSSKLPRGRSSLATAVVHSAHRGRLLRAVIAVVAEKGYCATTIADVVRGACVSREVFYAHFADKRACFLAACDGGSELMFRRVREAQRALPPDAEALGQLAAGVRAYLEFLVAEPEFARTFLFEIFAAGPEALERRAAVHAWFAARTRAWHERARERNPSWPAVPNDAYLAIIGAFYELVAERVREGRLDDLLELERPILQLHAALFADGAVALA